MREFLGELVAACGLSQRDVAGLMGVHESVLSKLLRGGASWSAARLAAFLTAVGATAEQRLRAFELAELSSAESADAA